MKALKVGSGSYTEIITDELYLNRYVKIDSMWFFHSPAGNGFENFVKFVQVTNSSLVEELESLLKESLKNES